MGFANSVSELALLSCGRHCSLCHKFCGTKIELHHIRQRVDNGDDTFDNCIPLCFDCHAEVQAYNPKHPKGKKFTENELKKHRDQWYSKMNNKSDIVTNNQLELKVINLEENVSLILEKIEQNLKETYTEISNKEKDEFDIDEVFSSKLINTGFPDLDKLLGGINHSELIVIASEPSMGKTNLALSIAKNISVIGKEKVAYFSASSLH